MLNLIYGNIVDDKILKNIDAIVNPTNPKMRYGMGVSEVIFKKAGIDELEKYCEEKFNVGYNDDQLKNDMKPTEVRVTPGFNLGCDIIFAQSPNNVYFKISDDELMPLLLRTYDNVLLTILNKKYKSVLIPSLGTGHYGFNHKDVAKLVVKKLYDFAKKNDVDINFILLDNLTKNIYEEELNKISCKFDSHYSSMKWLDKTIARYNKSNKKNEKDNLYYSTLLKIRDAQNNGTITNELYASLKGWCDRSIDHGFYAANILHELIFCFSGKNEELEDRIIYFFNKADENYLSNSDFLRNFLCNFRYYISRVSHNSLYQDDSHNFKNNCLVFINKYGNDKEKLILNMIKDF